MILSKRTRYAIVALARLARDYGKGPIQIQKIATEEKIPQRFLENILLDLRKKGILGSQLGKTGGYYLLKNPSQVSLDEIIKHFEGTTSLLYCICENSYRPCEFCKEESTCGIRKPFKEIYDSTERILKRTTLESLVQ